MKITDVKTYLMQVGARPGLPGASPTGVAGEADFRGSRNWLFVKIETDEGISGIGECSGWPRVVETAVLDYRTILIGEDPATSTGFGTGCLSVRWGTESSAQSAEGP